MIGPGYMNHRGGIGAILSIYAQYFDGFKFIDTYKYHDKNFTKSLYFLRQTGRLINTLIRDKKIKIVHIHGAQRGSFYRKYFIFLITKRIFGKKIVYHMHSGCFDTFYHRSNVIQKRLIRNFVNRADLIICLSQHWQDFFLKNFKTKQLLILNNVILQPESDRMVTPKPGLLPINFLFLGRIEKKKGIYDIIKVITKNKDYFSDKIKLYVGGEGEVDNLKNIIETNQLGGIVEYLGWIQDEQKDSFLSKTDVYILPSYIEGMPISILEAMSFRLPIISTPVGGIPEIVNDGINGILVEPGNSEQIFLALDFFIKNHTKIQEYGIASFEKAKCFFPENVFDKLEKIYKNLLTETSE